MPLYLNKLFIILKSNKFLQLWHGSIWTILGTFLTRGSGLFVGILVARILGKTATGEIGLIQSTVGMFGVLAGLGLNATASKFIAETKGTSKKRTGSILGFIEIIGCSSTIIASLCLLMLAHPIAEKILHEPNLTTGLRIASVLMMANGILGTQSGALAGFEAFSAIARSNIVSSFVTILAVSLGAFWYGLNGALWGLGCGAIAGCCVAILYLFNEMRKASVTIEFKGFFNESRLLWSFSLPILLTSLVLVPANWVCNVILTNSHAGLAAMGEFTIALQWRNLIVFGPQALVQVFLPALARSRGLNEMLSYKKIVILNLCVVSLFGVVLGLGVVLFSDKIALAYGNDFSSASSIIAIMAISGALISVNTVAGNVLTTLDLVWPGFVVCLITACLLVVFSVVLVPNHGAKGVALSNMFAYGLHTILQLLFVFKYLKKNN